MKAIQNIHRKILTLCMAMVLLISSCVVPVYATGDTIDVDMVGFPSGSNTGWQIPAVNFKGGWSHEASDYYYMGQVTNKGNAIAYCVQPGIHFIDYAAGNNPNDVPQKDVQSFLSSYDNGEISRAEIESFIGLVYQHGYTGAVSTGMSNDAIANAYASQLVIWEIIVGERGPEFNHIAPPSGKNKVLDYINANHPIKSQIMSHYDRIIAAVQKAMKIPSFMGKTSGGAPTVELTWDGSAYTKTLNDTNGVLGNFNVTVSNRAVTVTVSGNTLTLSAATAPKSPVNITAASKEKTKEVYVWARDSIKEKKQQGLSTPGDTLTYKNEAFLKLKVSSGGVEIIKKDKESSASLAGAEFTIWDKTGSTVVQKGTTNSSGTVKFSNLPLGEYIYSETTPPRGMFWIQKSILLKLRRTGKSFRLRWTTRKLRAAFSY